MNIILFMVLLYNVIVIGGIGWYLKLEEKRNHRITDMALGGRSAGLAAMSVTLAITYLGSAHVYGLMEMSFMMGAVALWFSFAHTILMCVICLGTGPWIRRMGCATIPELLGTLFGQRIRVLTACVGAMVVFGLVTLETQTIGIGISAMSGWSLGWASVVGAALGTAYVYMGGIKQTMWVNLVNAGVMYVSIFIAAVYLTFALPGGWDAVSQHYVDSGTEFKMSIFGEPTMLASFALASIFAVVFSQSVNQQGMQACMSAENEQVIRRSLWIAAPVNGMFGVFPVLVGLAAATLPQYAQLGPKLAGATLIVELLPTWLVILVQAGFLGALMSTFAMSALAPATIFAKDIVGSKIKGGLAPEIEKKLIQRALLVIGALAAFLTFFLHPNVILAITWLFAWLVPFFFIIISGLFWKRASGAALGVILCAWGVNMIWSFAPQVPAALGLQFLENAHIVAIVSLISNIIFNLSAKDAKPALFSGSTQVIVGEAAE
ncbi:sodium:solute symporter family protein [Pseudovibrio exalbescens]|uniref:sodium:solute symporter family protein n=1 Tax=Pseudovibrio exalbescens TaxID=197461 RepID=UPI0015E06BF9|nr:sodium:solute symporter family protein [Pseudovibrio exalbescens]